MSRATFSTAFTAAFFAISILQALAQSPAVDQTTPTLAPQAQLPAQIAPGPTPEVLQLQSELKRLQSDITAQREAQDVIKKYVELGAAIVAILGAIIAVVSIVGIVLQIIGFRVETRIRVRQQDEEVRSRARYQEETTKQTAREDALNDRYIKLLEVASRASETAQQKIVTLEEGGIKRADDTLQLINNLLQITERAAAKAAGAQFDFLSRSIGTFDAQCQSLITEATKDDDRDIIAKPEYRERVRVLTKQIDSLDNQIITYNESVPLQFTEMPDGMQTSDTAGLSKIWARLSLTGPCLFVRGLNHHLDQNFAAAIADWKSSLSAKNATAVQIDANYWIGYVNNTLGNFDQAPPFLLAAASVASEQRKVELRRLELETRLFDLDLAEVPQSLLDEGDRYYNELTVHRVTPRAISSFATTMGNISLIRQIRDDVSRGTPFALPEHSSNWFEKAIRAQSRSRWARFGLCQNLVFSGHQLDSNSRSAVEDVIGSVNREFQSRVEHRSKVLSKVTEYISLLMLGGGDKDRLSTIGGLIEHLTSDVIARTIYSQFRKQNVDKEVFLGEFEHLRKHGDLQETFRWANTKKTNKAAADGSGHSGRF